MKLVIVLINNIIDVYLIKNKHRYLNSSKYAKTSCTYNCYEKDKF